MAKVICEFCGNYIEDLEENCPVCGAPNKNHKRTASGTPKTIEELKNWYVDRNLPPEEVTRFFIGKDIKEPRAFGIYQDGDNFIVYKNKSDGSRAIRYKGTDEAYAVNELYIKLKEEILNQKNRNLDFIAEKPQSKSFLSKLVSFIMKIVSVIYLMLGLSAVILSLISIILMIYSYININFFTPKTAYYYYDNTFYYYLNDIHAKEYDNTGWYIYSDDSWDYYCDEDDTCILGKELSNHYKDYLVGTTISDVYSYTDNLSITWNIEVSEFEDTSWYQSYEKNEEDYEYSRSVSNSSNDSDWDWDSGDSWDSGYTNWDSDW